VKLVWVEKLGGFTASQIGSALKACDDRQYPPNLPEFIEMCRRAAKSEVNGLFLPIPELAKEELENRRVLLNALSVKLKGGPI